MGRIPRPWYRKSRGEWCVNIGGKMHRLGSDQANANIKFAALIRQKQATGPCDSTATFRTLCNSYLDWVQAHREASTLRWYADMLIGFVEVVGDDRLAVDVTPDELEKWSAKASWSASTRYAAVRVVKTVFNWAVDRGILDRSPVQQVRRPKPTGRERVLNEAEQKKVLAVSNDECWRTMVRMLLLTGCRPQEFRAIEARHFNSSARTVTFLTSESKGKKVRRCIVLNDQAARIVAEAAKDNPTGPIFRDSKGNPWTANGVRQRFARAADKLKIPELVAYTCRHTWATDALAGGIDVATVASLMGSSVQTVFTHYGHLLSKLPYLRRAANRATAGSDL